MAFANIKLEAIEMEEDRAMSPVLNNSRRIRKQFYKKKSRAKLMNRFESQNSTQENDVPNNQTEQLLDNVDGVKSIEQMPATKLNSTDVLQMSTSLNRQNEQEIGGFCTAAGRNIQCSQDVINIHSKLFDDILNPLTYKGTFRNKHNFLSKNTNNANERNKHLVDFKSYSFNENMENDKENIESLLQNNISIFDDQEIVENTDIKGFEQLEDQHVRKLKFMNKFIKVLSGSLHDIIIESENCNQSQIENADQMLASLNKDFNTDSTFKPSWIENGIKFFNNEDFTDIISSTEPFSCFQKASDCNLLTQNSCRMKTESSPVHNLNESALQELAEIKKLFDNNVNDDIDFYSITPSTDKTNKKRQFDDDEIEFKGFKKFESSLLSSKMRYLKKFIAVNIKDGTDEYNSGIASDNIVESPSKNKFNVVDFQSTCGGKFEIPEEFLTKSKKFFDDFLDADLMSNNVNFHNKSELSPGKKFQSCGFQTAGGRTIEISGEYLRKSEKLFDDLSGSDFRRNNKNFQNNKLEVVPSDNKVEISGFQTGGGRKLEIPRENLIKSERLFDGFFDCDLKSNKETFKHDKEEVCSENKIQLSAFQTAGGEELKIPVQSLEKSKILYNDCSDSDLKNTKPASQSFPRKRKQVDSKISNCDQLNRPKLYDCFDANFFNGNVSENGMKKAKMLFQDVFDDSNSNSNNALKSEKMTRQTVLNQNLSGDLSFERESSKNNVTIKRMHSFSPSIDVKHKKRLGVSACRSIPSSESKLAKSKLIFKDTGDSSIKPSDDSNLIENSSTPVRKQAPVCTTSTPLQQAPISPSHFLDATLTPIKRNDQVVNLDCDVVIKDSTVGNLAHWLQTVETERNCMEAKLRMIIEKERALTAQMAMLNSEGEHRRKRSGVLFLAKNNTTRISLRSLNRNENRKLEVSPQNAMKFHFKIAESNVAVTKTMDGAVIVPNMDNLVGMSEVDVAFRTMPAVDPKLIPNGWIGNHFKWIIWKLTSYVNNFPDLCHVLTVENVLQQLKYRYDREIDRAERSCVRKIFEKDDIPQKRMVLCVSSIKMINNIVELCLTDGWYEIRTLLDRALCNQVYNGKIRIGSKIMTCGAELMNCNGCHPLEATDSMHLQINYNSTRRAVWWAKLGYQANVEPFPVSLESIVRAGGTVGCVHVYIARIYPMRYKEQNDGVIFWRNKKADDKRQAEWENDRLKKIDDINESIRKEFEKEEATKFDRNYPLNVADVQQVTCPEMLYKLYRTSNDPDSFHEQLSCSQRSAILDYQTNLSGIKQQEISLKISKCVEQLKLSKREVTPVLKMLLIDAWGRSDKGVHFNLWRPTDELLQTLREGHIFKVYNVLQKSDGYLTSFSKTRFRAELAGSDSFNTFQRSLQSIPMIYESAAAGGSSPLFNEFDTVGLLVKMNIDSVNQNFWLSDSGGRLLFINVFSGPKDCSLLDNLKEGEVVAVSNLRANEWHANVAHAIANHCTVISKYPHQKHLEEGVQLLSQQLPKDINVLLLDCKNKIDHFIFDHNLKRTDSRADGKDLL